jgi:hypothetical protein
MDAFATGDFLKVNPDTYWDIPHYPVESFRPDYQENLPAVDWSYLEPDAQAETSTAADDVLVSANIIRLRPSRNTLVITVDTGDMRLKKTFEISNIASENTYQVGGYAVHICTEGMDVIECNVSIEKIAA